MWIKIIITAAILFTGIAQAATNYWKAGKIYEANTTVIYNNTTWLARWYTQNEIPGSIGSAWLKISLPSSSPQPNPIPTLTAKDIKTVSAPPAQTTTSVASPALTTDTTTATPIKRIFHLNKPNQLTAQDLLNIEREPLISTGLWVDATDTITISYYNPGTAPQWNPSILIHDLNEELWDDISDQQLELKIGTNTVQILKSGFLIIASNNKPSSCEMVIEIVSGGNIAKSSN